MNDFEFLMKEPSTRLNEEGVFPRVGGMSVRNRGAVRITCDFHLRHLRLV